MITLAVFDMAGTTVNDGGAVYRALEQAVSETGAPVDPRDLQTWMGAEKRAAIAALIELGGGDPDGRVEPAFTRFREILAELYRADPPTPVAGVPEALRALRASGVRIALTTGFSRDVATGILDVLGWRIADGAPTEATGTATTSTATGTGEVVLDALVCGDEVAAGRPAPYMIHRAMERTGTVDVAEVLVAGDTVVDVRAGANSGASVTIGVLTGKLAREDFSGEPATAVLPSAAGIPAYLADATELVAQGR